MKCPKCNRDINPLKSKTNGFRCENCGENLCVKGNFAFHVFASFLFIVEAMILFSWNISTWILVVIISVLALLNYYLSSKLFLHATEKHIRVK